MVKKITQEASKLFRLLLIELFEPWKSRNVESVPEKLGDPPREIKSMKKGLKQAFFKLFFSFYPPSPLEKKTLIRSLIM